MNAEAHVASLLAEVAAGPAGPLVGAYFDLDGTLVSGFTATVHAGHRIRNRQARVGEVLGVIEASIRYRLGRMEFERLVERAGGYLRGESLAELDELGEWLFSGTSKPGSSRPCATSCARIRTAVTRWCSARRR